MRRDAKVLMARSTGPQGGVKGSGWGRQNSRWGFEEFLQEKFISWHGGDGSNPSLGRS